MDAGRAVTPSPLALLSDSAHIAPGERALCVSADAFEDSLHGTHSDQSCPDPPFLHWGAVPEPYRRGWGLWCDLAGQPARSLPGLTAFPRPTLFSSPAKTQMELSVPPAVPPSPNTNHSPC